ncbi:hypothetical protein IFM89_006728 [Coptis chinensis]|uniref:Uncharacterized protein n=1 Tax=Coptis chinensis TaxID=261450 RepID=A0A835HTC6_9MAGN|nr:hypothetical protein IFM89_006728 [Coptis chinensis]
MAAAGLTAKSLLLSRFNDLSIKSKSPLKHNFFRPTLKKPSFSVVNCLFDGGGGGGVADDFVVSSTRNKHVFDRGFIVISKMLKKIEPFDTCTVSKGVSPEAKDSMKRTISTMLGLLPSDQFSVSIRVSRRPLDRLLASSIITGYTLWNAEYRVSLMRNFDLSSENAKAVSVPLPTTTHDVVGSELEVREGGCGEEERIPQGLGDLSPEALDYIRTLKSELAIIEKELNAKKQENMRLECNGDGSNDLLEYLRSLEPDMVNELSRPSSLEVEETINELVQNVLERLFKDGASGFFEDSVIGKTEQYQDGAVELSDTISTSRDYLAKLLFWLVLTENHLLLLLTPCTNILLLLQVLVELDNCHAFWFFKPGLKIESKVFCVDGVSGCSQRIQSWEVVSNKAVTELTPTKNKGTSDNQTRTESGAVEKVGKLLGGFMEQEIRVQESKPPLLYLCLSKIPTDSKRSEKLFWNKSTFLLDVDLVLRGYPYCGNYRLEMDGGYYFGS